MSEFFSSRFQALQAYTPGEQPRDRSYIKLNTNESPFAPSPLVAQRVGKAQAESLNLYSDPTCLFLRRKLAALYGLQPENVLCTNGSDEALNFAFMAYCDKTTGVAYPQISYGFYSVFAALHGINALEIPLQPDFSIDYRDYCACGRTVVIANPNAPTALALPLWQIEEIVRTNPQNVVVIDEAYIDFGGESAVPLLQKYENLLVVQTYSKSKFLAGARLGYAMGNKKLIADLETLRCSTNPYNINTLTLLAGEAVLDDIGYYQAHCKEIIAVRKQAEQLLRQLSFTMTESCTNFIFAKSEKIDGKELYLRLKDKGFLVRHFDTPAIAQYNRITVGTLPQMQALCTAIQEIYAEKGL